MADEYRAVIQTMADALIDGGDTDVIIEALDPLEWNRWHYNLRVICKAKTESSRAKACDEIKSLLNSGAYKAAEKLYHAEMNDRAKQIALERFYRYAEMECAA
jgi:hypothetical protein